MPVLSRTPAALRSALLSVLMLLTGGVAAVVWVWLADPAQWEVRESGIVMTEAASRGQFSVIVVFVIIGAIASVLWGALAAVVLGEIGWRLAPFVIVVTVAASLLTWRLGVALGPAGPLAVADPAVGDRLPAELLVDGVAPFLVWPIFGLIGVLGATWSTHRREARAQPLGW